MVDRVLDYGIDPSTGGMTVRREADGSLNIDIRPRGILSVLMGIPEPRRHPWTVGIGITIAAGGVMTPLVIGYFFMPLKIHLLGVVCMVMALGILAVCMVPLARRHVSIFVNVQELTVESHDPVEDQRYRWRREEITDIRAAMSSTGPDYDSRQWEMQICVAGKQVSLLDHLPPEQVREVAKILRGALGLDPESESRVHHGDTEGTEEKRQGDTAAR